MNQLTKEEKARVFAIYFGCRYIHDSGTFPANTGVNDSCLYHIVHGNDIEDPRKLLLTPLCCITDEHAIEVARIAYGNIDNRLLDIAGRNFIKQTYCFKQSELSKQRRIGEPNLCHINTHQYLIQQDYAVPLFFGLNHWANGKTAIELGIAIDKTQTNLKQ